MAEYEMQESNLPNEEGKRILFPRMVINTQRDLEDIAKAISQTSTFSPGDIKGLIIALADEIAYRMGEGCSVKIDGIGTFTPSLGLRKGIERESNEEGGQKRNSVSIDIDNIDFRADKEFIVKTGMNCTLHRSKKKFQRSSQNFSPDERLQKALKHLETHPFITVLDYCRLTGLLRNAAAQELRRWKADPQSGIDSIGKGSHKVYVRKN